MEQAEYENKLFKRIHDEYIDTFDEEMEMEFSDLTEEMGTDESVAAEKGHDLAGFRKAYFKELYRLQVELVRLQEWVVHTGHKLVAIFEGRDAAGKGGAIKRITQRLNPRVCRVAALPAPTDREKSQWYFQRYVSHLPAAGEIVLFDRSWYNRAGVERVMGFCSDDEYEEFFRSVPEFEKMLVRSGIQLIKFWFSISDEEQQFRFNCRLHDPLKKWKLSPMDLESRRRWELYTQVKEIMLERTSIPEAYWWIIEADNKKRARLNCINHLLKLVPYQAVERNDHIELPPRQRSQNYTRKDLPDYMYVPDYF
jgi:polyphosphate kinase 2